MRPLKDYSFALGPWTASTRFLLPIPRLGAYAFPVSFRVSSLSQAVLHQVYWSQTALARGNRKNRPVGEYHYPSTDWFRPVLFSR